MRYGELGAQGLFLLDEKYPKFPQPGDLAVFGRSHPSRMPIHQKVHCSPIPVSNVDHWFLNMSYNARDQKPYTTAS